MNYLPVKGYEGKYEISPTGAVRSIDRVVVGRDGVNYPFKGHNLTATVNVQVHYLQVTLWADNTPTTLYVHRLVAITYLPNPTNLAEVNHIDGNRTNPHKDNLEWCDRVGNVTHAIQTGLRKYTNRLNHSQFMECLHAVIDGESFKSVCERVPYKVPFLSTKLRKLARDANLEALLDVSLYEQRVIRARINGAKNH